MLNAGFRLSTYSCRYTVQECVKLGCLIDKASKLLCVWVCVWHRSKNRYEAGRKEVRTMCLCVCGCTRMSGVVSAEKYLNIMEDFVVCLRLESLYMCARPLYMSASPPPKDLQRFITCCTYTYLSPWRHARSLVHNKHAYTASGERVCDLEGDNSVARPHRRQLSTE